MSASDRKHVLRGASTAHAEKGKNKDKQMTDATIAALDKNARPLTKEEMKHFGEGVEKAHEGDPAEATFKGATPHAAPGMRTKCIDMLLALVQR